MQEARDPDMEPTAPRAPDGLSLVGLLNVLLRYRRTIAWSALGVAAVVAVITFVSPRRYASSGAFMPTNPSGNLSQLAGLASQFGVNVGSAASGTSPEFYGSLLNSPAILRDAVRSHYRFSVAGDTLDGTIPSLLGTPGDNEAQQVAYASKWLSRATAVSVDKETGIVTVTVTTQWAGFSQEIASRLLDLVSRFNQEVRQSQAKAEREFVEGRLADATRELRAAEGALQQFMQRNREFQNSPALTVEYQRLQREVSLRESLQTSLAQSYDQARINEVRDTPVVTILEKPILPPLPVPRRLIVKTILGFLFGAAAAIVFAFSRDFFRRARSAPDPDSVAYRELSADALGPVRRTAGRLGTLLGRDRGRAQA